MIKKSLYIFLAFLLIFSCFSFVLAQETTTPSTTPTTDTGQAQSQTQTTTLINQQQVKDVSKKVATSLNDQTKDVFQNEVVIPLPLQGVLGLFVGIESPIMIKNLLIIIGVWLIIFIFIFDLLGIFAEQYKWVRGILAFIITSLMSMTGSFQPLSDFFYHLTDFLPFVAGNTIIKTILAVVICILILVLFMTSKRILFKGEKKSEARIGGMKIGAAMSASEEIIRPPRR